MEKNWQAILETERVASRTIYVQGCGRNVNLGSYWRGKYYISFRADPSEAIFRAKAFAYTLEHLPLTFDPRQRFACGMETYQVMEVPEEIKNDYAVCIGADAGRGRRNFTVGNDHTVPDYRTVLSIGLDGILARIADSRRYHTDAKSLANLEAMEIGVKAIQAFSLRFAESLKKTDPELSACLTRIAGPAPTSFFDALQLTWLLFIVLQSQGRNHDALGRIDQYLIDFYRRDIADGKLTREDALDMLCHIWTKVEGVHDTTNIAIAGITPDGKDATNELSYLALEATGLVKSPSTNISARFHDNTPDDFYKACAKLISTGIGFPAVFNDEVTIPMLEQVGVKTEHARDYCMVGCVETLVAGRQQAWSDGRFDTQICFETVLKRLDTYETYEALYNDLLVEIAKRIQTYVDNYNANLACYSPERLPDPVLSAFTQDCIARALDLNDGGSIYRRFHGVGMMGIGTITDSLSVLKKLVFEEKRVSKKEVMAALEANFEGHEALRQMFINATPKYGNDDDYADSIAVDLVRRFGEMWRPHKTLDGGQFFSCMATNISNIPAGRMVGATPDGRFAHTALSDAASPNAGYDRKGPTAFIKSICKPDYTQQNCTVVNLRFSPDFFKGEDGIGHFCALLKEFVRGRGHEMQFNVTDNADLQDAREHPEKYGSLVVRVSGFSAYFTRLDPSIQDDIIRRRAHVKS